MANIIDRRKRSGKSGQNRQRFLKRVSNRIKKSLPDVVNNNSIKNMTSKNGKIKVPIKGINEPTFKPDFDTGSKDLVKPGNDKWNEGDRIPKPLGDRRGIGKKGSKDGENTEDNFIVELTKEEFLQYFFQDLELPDMIKKQLGGIEGYKIKRAGYSNTGIPPRLNKKQSVKKAIGRKLSIKSSLENEIKKIEDQLNSTVDKQEKEILTNELIRLKNKLENIPFLSDIDLKYNNIDVEPIPITSAVMFSIMDVSGSMGIHEKDIAKRFFMLLYLFLLKEYEHIDLVFIRHTTEAKEVGEDEFFNSRESGGTVVSSALELMKNIINRKYSNGQWNLYCAQVSDGDVWGKEDADECTKLLDEILPKLQYMTYVEVDRYDDKNRFGKDLWKNYNLVAEHHKNLTVSNISEVNEIWPVFIKLFKRKSSVETK